MEEDRRRERDANPVAYDRGALRKLNIKPRPLRLHSALRHSECICHSLMLSLHEEAMTISMLVTKWEFCRVLDFGQKMDRHRPCIQFS